MTSRISAFSSGPGVRAFYKIRIVPDHFWMARRFLPVILPGTLLLAAAAALTGVRGRLLVTRAIRAPIGIVFLALLAVNFARVARPVVDHVEYAGVIPKIEQLAEIAVSARYNAGLNPDAYYREPITIDDVQSSAMIADPLTKLHCCIRSDGGGAIVLTSEERARDLAGMPVYVLGSGETCTGDPARRLGNEFLFQMQGMQNVETLNSVERHGNLKIVATCPHCFNTIANEYPQLGGHYEVVHHTQLLGKLVDEGKLVPYATAAFEAYWGGDRDISTEDVLADIAARAGIERQRFFSGIETGGCKARLRANTDELIQRGGFGSPTMFVGKSMFFGNDRLPLVKAALESA